jgi:hypothetical protein
MNKSGARPSFIFKTIHAAIDYSDHREEIIATKKPAG